MNIIYINYKLIIGAGDAGDNWKVSRELPLVCGEFLIRRGGSRISIGVLKITCKFAVLWSETIRSYGAVIVSSVILAVISRNGCVSRR